MKTNYRRDKDGLSKDFTKGQRKMRKDRGRNCSKAELRKYL